MHPSTMDERNGSQTQVAQIRVDHRGPRRGHVSVAPAARPGAVDRHDFDLARAQHRREHLLAALVQGPLAQGAAEAGVLLQKVLLFGVGHQLGHAADEQVICVDDHAHVIQDVGEDAGRLQLERLPLMLLPGLGAEHGALEEQAGVVHGQQFFAQTFDAGHISSWRKGATDSRG